MAAINFDKMTLEQLLDLEPRLENAIAKAKEKEKAELKQKLEALASSKGFRVEDLYSSGRGRGVGKGGKVAVKYVNPDNRSETWTGRGRQPRWLVAKLGKGGKINDYMIKS